MDVTIDNFDLVSSQIKGLCESCDFIAFDEEMTGININDPALRTSIDDDPSERYLKMRQIASRYSIISFGICFFHRKVDLHGVEKFEATPFNFYVFPSSNQDVIMSASSIDFLKKHNMDFHQWINKGVTYCNEDHENQLYAKNIEPLYSPTAASDIALIELRRTPDIQFFDGSVAKFKDFFDNPLEITFTFDKCNGFLRKALYLFLDKFYADTVCTSTNENGQLVATRLSEENKTKIREDKLNEAMAKFKKQIGFRSVINDIINSRKPIVGHNCFYDVLFMMNSFIAPLSADLDDLRVVFHDRFPCIFDTKYIAECGVLGNNPVFESVEFSSALGPLYQTFLSLTTESDKEEEKIEDEKASASSVSSSSESIMEHSSPSIVDDGRKAFVYCRDDFAQYVSGEALHNAGYDAYLTGSLFAMQIKFHKTARGCTDCIEAFADLSLGRKNILFQMFSIYDINLDNTSNSGVIKRDYEGKMFHYAVPDEKISFKEIEQTFLNAGIEKSNIYVHRIDRTNFYFVSVKGDLGSLNVSEISPSDWVIQNFSDYVETKQEKKEQITSNNSIMQVDSSSTAAIASVADSSNSASAAGTVRKTLDEPTIIADSVAENIQVESASKKARQT